MQRLRKFIFPLLFLIPLSSCKPTVDESSSKTSIPDVSTSVSEEDTEVPITSEVSEPEGTTSEEVSVPKVHVITWEGIEDEVVQLGDDFDLMEGVRAYDSIDGELTVTLVDDDFFSPNYASGYTIIYSATNSVGTKSTKYRSINVIKGVNVENGAFEFGKAYWTFDQPGGTGTFNVVNEQAVIEVTNAGSEAWSIQLYQTGIQFEANKTYELSFIAKSDYGRSVSAGFENVSNNYAMMVAGYQAVQLTSEFTRYSVLCTTTVAVGYVKVVIYLGQGLTVDSHASRTNPIDITIDDIRVREFEVAPVEKQASFINIDNVGVNSKDQFEQYPAVQALDYQGNDITDRMEIIGEVPVSVNAITGMMLSYRVTDAEGNFTYHNRRVGFGIAKAHPYNMINSSFENGMQGWIQDVNQTNGTGKADFYAEDGELTVDIKNGSNDNWHIQLYQNNITLTAGKIYRTTVIAKASVERTMTIEVSNPALSFAKIASDLVTLTTEYQTFDLEFKANVTTNAKVALLLAGQGANKVTLSYFENTMITEQEATTIDFRDYADYEIVNGDFKYGFYGWSKESTHGTDVEFIENRAEETVTLNVLQSSSADWHAQISQDGRKFLADVTYTIEIEIEATLNTLLRIEAVNINTTPGIGNETLIKEDINVTSTKTKFTATFTPAIDYNQGKISLLIGESEICAITVHSLIVVKG
ncbi:MAG TPA: carbohydrate binding domain-containing protein [Bacilli bacterium]|nr:carbohydrate binding domain-containing protein [Bacilli bacterium]